MNKSIIKWFGGKNRMVNKIVPLIQQIKHEIYCEPFGGGATVLINKPLSKCEIYNDINSDLVNFFRVIRDKDKFTNFYQQVQVIPFSREEFEYAKENYATVEDDILKAVLWFVRIRQSFAGVGAHWAISKTGTDRGDFDVASWLSSIENLPELVKRLLKVKFENNPWEYMFERYDTENTLYYSDPPYFPSERSKTHYDHEMSIEEHEKFLNTVLNSKGKHIISGYDNETYDQMLCGNGWKKVEFTVGVASFQNIETTKKKVAKETIWVDPKTSRILVM